MSACKPIELLQENPIQIRSLQVNSTTGFTLHQLPLTSSQSQYSSALMSDVSGSRRTSRSSLQHGQATLVQWQRWYTEELSRSVFSSLTAYSAGQHSHSLPTTGRAHSCRVPTRTSKTASCCLSIAASKPQLATVVLALLRRLQAKGLLTPTDGSNSEGCLLASEHQHSRLRLQSLLVLVAYTLDHDISLRLKQSSTL